MGSLLIDITNARPMMLYWSNDAYGLYHVLSEIGSQYTHTHHHSLDYLATGSHIQVRVDMEESLQTNGE